MFQEYLFLESLKVGIANDDKANLRLDLEFTAKIRQTIPSIDLNVEYILGNTQGRRQKIFQEEGTTEKKTPKNSTF